MELKNKVDAISMQYKTIVAEFSKSTWVKPMPLSAEEASCIVRELYEPSSLSLLIRSFNPIFGAYPPSLCTAPESVAGHSNLAREIITRYLDHYYPDDSSLIEEKYSKRQIEKAVGMHDWSENSPAIGGDLPDNGTQPANKTQLEADYWKTFRREINPSVEPEVLALIQDMVEHKSPIGRTCYLADKASAIIMAHIYERRGVKLRLHPEDTNCTKKDSAIIQHLKEIDDNGAPAYDIFAYDYFKYRKLVDLDDTGFISSILIMTALMFRDGQWYDWN